MKKVYARKVIILFPHPTIRHQYYYTHSFPIVTSLRVVLSAPKMISYNSTVFEGFFTACRLLSALRSVNASVPFEIKAAKASTDSPTFPVEVYPKVSIDPFMNFRLIFLEFNPSCMTIYWGLARSGR